MELSEISCGCIFTTGTYGCYFVVKMTRIWMSTEYFLNRVIAILILCSLLLLYARHRIFVSTKSINKLFNVNDNDNYDCY